MPELIAYYDDINQAVEEEKNLPPGTYDIRFYLNAPLTSEDIKAISQHLIENGVDVKKVYQNISQEIYLGVQYQRHEATGISFLPLAVIPLIGFVLVAALVGLGIFKIGDITSAIGKLLLIALGGTALVALALRKPIEKVVEKRF